MWGNEIVSMLEHALQEIIYGVPMVSSCFYLQIWETLASLNTQSS